MDKDGVPFLCHLLALTRQREQKAASGARGAIHPEAAALRDEELAGDA